MPQTKVVRIQIYTRDEAFWASNGNKVLARGQFGALQHSTDPLQNVIGLGDGVTDWDNLPKLGVSGGVPSHNHDDRYYTESEIDTALGIITTALNNHNHDDRYYTESEIDSALQLVWDELGSHTHDNRYYKTSQTYSNIEIDDLLTPKEDSANKGAANGYAPLDGSSKVPSAYLPSYVDDVLEYATVASLPLTGEIGKLYVITSGPYINKQFRWSGSAYVEIIASPGTTDAVTEGLTNLYFTVSRVLATLLTGLSTADASTIASVDSILVAMGKLQAQVSNRVLANAAITGATKTKVTYDSKGLVTGGADFVIDDISNATSWAKALLGVGNPSAIRFIRINADNTVTLRTAVELVSDLSITSTNPLTIFGDGSSGDTTITGPVTLTEDMYYNNLTISGAGSINTNGFRIFVLGTLDLTNAGALAIYNNGVVGNTGTVSTVAGVKGGVGQTSPGWSPAENSGIAISGAGGAGASTNTNNATVGGAPTTIGANTRHNNGGPGGAGGAGGASLFGGAAGGAAQATSTSPVANIKRNLIHDPLVTDFSRLTLTGGSGAITSVNIVGGRHGGGGGGAGPSATANGRSGGSGGGGGGVLIIYANIISIGASTNAEAIAANGGNGGNGGASAFNGGGGGGGGAGGGGYIYLVTNTISGGSYTFMSANGGTGGTGSNGLGAGAIGGTGGTGGAGGRLTIIRIQANTITQVDGTGNTAAAPTTASTITGTSGTTGGTCTYTA